MIIIGIIIAIIIFSIIILIHEFGHFKAARKFGVRVEEFGLGIPPRAKELFRDKHGTLYSLNWLPLGGFVRLTGEQINTFKVYDKDKKLYNNEDLEKDLKNKKDVFLENGEKIEKKDRDYIFMKLEENKADYNLINKKTWQQAIIILAGVFMNFLLAIFIFSALFFIGVKPIGINDKIETSLDLKLIPTYNQAIERGILVKNPGVTLYPIEESIAIKSGILYGDIVNKIKTESSESIINNPEDFINIVSKNAEKELLLYIKRNSECPECSKPELCDICIEPAQYLEIKITPSKEGKIGSYLQENIEINKDFVYKYSLFESLKYGSLETYNQGLLTFKAIGILIKKIFNPETPKERQEAIESMKGPIGMVDFISNSISAGIVFLLIIGAIISINLGVFNLLPIPALDGGRFIFISINSILKKLFGKKIISQNLENIIHLTFFVFLIALSLIIAYNDINNIISK